MFVKTATKNVKQFTRVVWNKKHNLFPFKMNRTQMWISNKTTCNNNDTSASAKNTKGKKEKGKR